MRVLVIAAAVACLLSGCAEGRADDAIEETTQANPSADEVTVLVSEPVEVGMEALDGGRLEVLGGCLGADGSVVIWPHGTEIVNDEPLTVDIPNNGTFALGDEVRLTGGFVLEHSSQHEVEPGDYQAGGVTVPADCAKYDIFAAH